MMKFESGHQYDSVPASERDGDALSKKRTFIPAWCGEEIGVSRAVIVSLITILILQTLLLIVGGFQLAGKGGKFVLPVSPTTLRDNDGNYYPAASAIKYETRTFEYNKTFLTLSGSPSNETDAAWHDLQEPTDGMIQAAFASGFDLDSLPASVTAREDESFRVYGLEVYHQLHCLDYVRKSFWPKKYFPNDSEYKVVHHREHCIEHLRNSIMCSGDFALDYWIYDEEDKRKYLKTDVKHVCRSFEAMGDWVEKNKWSFIWYNN